MWSAFEIVQLNADSSHLLACLSACNYDHSVDSRLSTSAPDF
jgi:hypothetical protein